TGPAEMSEHLRYLSKHASLPVSVMPNAGLPVLGKNGAEYPLTAEELAEALRGFVTDYGLSMVGGCCGTTPEHIRAVRDAVVGVPEGETPVLESVPAGPVEGAEREVEVEDAVGALYTYVPLNQGTGVPMTGYSTIAVPLN